MKEGRLGWSLPCELVGRKVGGRCEVGRHYKAILLRWNDGTSGVGNKLRVAGVGRW